MISAVDGMNVSLRLDPLLKLYSRYTSLSRTYAGWTTRWSAEESCSGNGRVWGAPEGGSRTLGK